jgi:hypothetical protein
MNKTASRSAGKLAPNQTVPQVGAQCRVGHRQQQQNAALFLERMRAAAAKHRNHGPSK